MASTEILNPDFDCAPGYVCGTGSLTPYGGTASDLSDTECPEGSFCEPGEVAELCAIGYFRKENRGNFSF